jgi:hypothetical protein
MRPKATGAQFAAQVKEAPMMELQRRVAGFLKASRVTWAQTGNGMQGQPARLVMRAGSAPIKGFPGVGGARPPPGREKPPP